MFMRLPAFAGILSPMVVRRIRAVSGPSDEGGHFAPSLLYTASKMYYEEDATQAEIAVKLRTSRATVSRLLSEARRQGIVRIEVIAPGHDGSAIWPRGWRRRSGLKAVHISAALPASTAAKPVEDVLGSVLAPAVGRALSAVGLVRGDILLVSSGRTMYEVAQFDLPHLPGVVVAPTVGGTDQPEGWYQTNEITRRVAERIGGRATYLFAPALPGPELFQTLQRRSGDPAGAAPVAAGALRADRRRGAADAALPGAAVRRRGGHRRCSRRSATSARGSSTGPAGRRLPRQRTADRGRAGHLQKIPTVIAVAAGRDKVAPMIAGARAHYFNQLVTDPRTAEEILLTG